MKARITDANITRLKDNQIFVFGSNEGGHHGAGAARTAMKWGAKYGVPEGQHGDTYAIPTKNADITKTLSIDKIKVYVDRFIIHAKANPHKTYLVTEIGCGLAGLKPKEVAPLFVAAKEVSNIHLPAKFWHVLGE